MKPPTRKRQLRGFTLIEIMVVIVLMGILATFAVMSVGSRVSDDRLENEAKRMEAVMQLAADEAQLKGLQIGLHFTVSGFDFVVADDKQHWSPYAADGPLRARQWAPGVAADLSIDGHLVPPAPDEAPNLGTSPAGVTNAAEDSNDPAKDPLRPQVLLLSSGEMTPFVLDMKAVGVPIYYHFEGDLFGRLTVARREFVP